MKPIIGIIGKYEILPSGNRIIYNYLEIVNKVIDSGGIPIQINISNNIDDVLELINNINGVILQGGDFYTDYEKTLIKYLYEEDIPLLGICLGMQTMGEVFGGNLEAIKEHNKKNKYSHDVIIDKNSNLYKILGKTNIKVNSRHNYRLVRTNLNISGISNDYVIEAIEDLDKKFFMGFQWHPESLDDLNSKKIFDFFIDKMKEGN